MKYKNNDETDDDENGNDHDAEINKRLYEEMLKSFEITRRGLQLRKCLKWFLVHHKNAKCIMRINTFS